MLSCVQQLADTEGNLLTPFIGNLLPHILTTLQAEDMESRRNAAYAVSAFCNTESIVQQFTPKFPQLLQTLFPLFSATEVAG